MRKKSENSKTVRIMKAQMMEYVLNVEQTIQAAGYFALHVMPGIT